MALVGLECMRIEFGTVIFSLIFWIPESELDWNLNIEVSLVGGFGPWLEWKWEPELEQATPILASHLFGRSFVTISIKEECEYLDF